MIRNMIREIWWQPMRCFQIKLLRLTSSHRKTERTMLKSMKVNVQNRCPNSSYILLRLHRQMESSNVGSLLFSHYATKEKVDEKMRARPYLALTHHDSRWHSPFARWRMNFELGLRLQNWRQCLAKWGFLHCSWWLEIIVGPWAAAEFHIKSSLFFTCQTILAILYRLKQCSSSM